LTSPYAADRGIKKNVFGVIIILDLSVYKCPSSRRARIAESP
jgi:hypothetical protein